MMQPFSHRPRRITVAALALVLAPTLAACGESGQHPTLRVLAASSLTDAFESLKQQFEKEHPNAEVQISFGSSTDLADQAADGAPGDVLATADPTSMKVATDARVADGPTRFASNVLVLVTPPDNPAHVHGLADLAGTTWVRCAEEAPCGKVASAVLADHHVTAKPKSLEDDARSTLDKVTSGEADAALVYASDATSAGDAVTTIPIPGAARERTTYLIATLEQSSDIGLAQAWTDLVTGPDGQRVLSEEGFTVQ